MAKKKGITLSHRTLGALLIAALLIQYVFPVIRLGSLTWIGTMLVLVVAVYLLL